MTKIKPVEKSTLLMDFAYFMFQLAGLILVISAVAWLFSIELDTDSYAMIVIGVVMYKSYIKPTFIGS